MEFEKEIISDQKLARLRAIFDPHLKFENDEDLIELAKYVEDETNESDVVIDHDFDFGDSR